MYSIIKKVINRGRYDLSGILTKVETLWAEGELTDGEREELTAAARAGANAQHSVDVLKKLEELEQRVRALEGESTEAKPYVPGKWYYAGDACVVDGVTYVCTAPEGVACVWSPADYPPYWTAQ